MLEHATDVFEFSENNNYNDFVSNKMKLLAVIRCFEIIGEAAAMISEETKIKNPLIE